MAWDHKVRARPLPAIAGDPRERGAPLAVEPPGNRTVVVPVRPRLGQMPYFRISMATVPATGTVDMLLGRTAELARLRALVARARKGGSGALLVRGEPGIGKTALLAAASAQAGAMRVLRARGVQSEAELAFAGLAELLGPVLELRAEIPPLQAASVAGALGVGEPVPYGRFALLAGTLSLLAAAAERAPLLVVVDDVHWLDAPSAQALLFVARRLRYEGIALLLAQRDSDPHGFGAAGIETLELGGLDARASGELLRLRRGPEVSETVARELCGATRGNPLALRVAADLLDPAQLRGARPLPHPLPVGERLGEAFLQRTRRLSPGCVQALTVAAAASGAGDTAGIEAALRALDLAIEDLREAEDAGLIALGAGGVEFEHPLLRAALYEAAPAAGRREIHAALAATLPRQDQRRAWHLAASSDGPDEAVALELQQAAERAAQRGAYMTAASLWEHAAASSPDAQARARRLHGAANEAHLGGATAWAVQRVERALELAREPLLRAEIANMRGALEQYAGSTVRARELLVAEAETLLAREDSQAGRRLATLILLDAAATSILTGDILAAHATARRASEVAAGVPGAVGRAPAALEGTLAMVRGAAPPEERLGTAADELMSAGDLPVGAFWLAQLAISDLVFSERYGEARATLERALGGLRALSAFGVLVLPLIAQAELDYRTGRWIAARGAALEAVEIAADAEELSFGGMAHATAARIEAARGRRESCLAHAARAREIASAVGVRPAAVNASAALGLCALGEGRCEEAMRELTAVAEQTRRDGVEHPAVIQWGADLIEAQVRAGDLEGARRTLERFEQCARRSQHTWALAAAERCAGLLADGESFAERFEQARRWHRHTATPFEAARTELCYGERLRREGRRAEARAPLEAALATFTQLGAESWSRRAREELGATAPARSSNEPRAALARLTSQELRVASVVAGGATNREAAAALFLSPKTVNAHLESIYRKLAITRRSQLARIFAQSGDPSPQQPDG